MAKSKLVKTNQKIAESVVNSYKNIENGVTKGFTKISDNVVKCYEKIEDKFVDEYLTHDGETIEASKKRLKEEQKKREEK